MDIKKDIDKNLTFKPDIGKSISVLKGDKATERPIYERIGQLQKKKQEYLHKLRLEAEMTNPDLTFKPRINEKSEQLAEQKIDNPNVTERLVKDAAEKVYKKMHHAEEYQNELSSICTFKPSINPISGRNDEFLQNNEVYKYQKDVIARQYILSDLQKERMEKKIAENFENCSFVPKINQISNFLVEVDGERANESLEQKLERLSKKDAQKREIFQEQMQKAYYDQYKFQPQINPISKGIGRKTSIETLAYNKEAKEHIMLLKQAAANAELEGCSFRPIINSDKYENIEPMYKDKENIMDNIKLLQKKKEIEIDQQKKIAEYQEFKDCTFKPEIKSKVPETIFKEKLAKSVAGMEKFLEARDRKKKLDEDKKLREEQVFHIEKRYSSTKHEGSTIPRPFSLSKGFEKSILKQKLENELKSKESNNTFRPKTNEGRNKEIIRKLIQG